MMTRARILTAISALASGIAIGAVAMWLIGSAAARNDVSSDAQTIYCADNNSKVQRAIKELGHGTSYVRACNALVDIEEPALEKPSSQAPAWQSILLGSSVVTALLTSAINIFSTTHAARRARAYSMTDAVFDAYADFYREARSYIDHRGSLKEDPPPDDGLRARHADLRVSLQRLPDPGARDSVHLLDELCEHIYKWPPRVKTDPSAYADRMSSMLTGLGDSINATPLMKAVKREPARKGLS